MNFVKTYRKIKPSIVAIASKISLNPEMPDIIGTGFIAREDGVIFTNDHVIKVIKKLPRLKSMLPEEWSAIVLYFYWLPSEGMAIVPMEIDGVGTLRRDEPVKGYNYGPDIPDLGIIRVKVKSLPYLKIAKKFSLNEGDNIFISGFPMGTDALRAPGWLHQVSPTLQSGIVGSILPFPCDEPHAVLIDIMSLGGSSGSPVISPVNGEVLGIVYAGLIQTKKSINENGGIIYQNNTSLTYAIPSNIITGIYDKIDKIRNIQKIDTSKFDTIESLIKKLNKKILPPKIGKMGKNIDPNEIRFLKK